MIIKFISIELNEPIRTICYIMVLNDVIAPSEITFPYRSGKTEVGKLNARRCNLLQRLPLTTLYLQLLARSPTSYHSTIKHKYLYILSTSFLPPRGHTNTLD